MSDSLPRRRPVRPSSTRQPKGKVPQKRKPNAGNNQNLIIGLTVGAALILIIGITFSGLLSAKKTSAVTSAEEQPLASAQQAATNDNFPPANDTPQRILDDELENFIANTAQFADYMTGRKKSGFGEYMKQQREQMASLGERKLFVPPIRQSEYTEINTTFSKKMEAERANLRKQMQSPEQAPNPNEIDPEFKAFTEEMMRFQTNSLVSFQMESGPLMLEFEPGIYPEFSQFLISLRKMCGELAVLRHRKDWNGAYTQLNRIKTASSETANIQQTVDQSRHHYRNVLVHYMNYVASEIDAATSQPVAASALSDEIKTHLSRFDYRDSSTASERNFTFRVTPECQNQVRTIMVEKDLLNAHLVIAVEYVNNLPRYRLGLQTADTFDSKPYLIVPAGISVAVKKDSLKELNGTTLDWVEEDGKSGFKFFNPNRGEFKPFEGE